MLLFTNSYGSQGDTKSYGGNKSDLTEYNKPSFKIIQCQPGVKDCLPETKAINNNQIPQKQLIPLIKKYDQNVKESNSSIINYVSQNGIPDEKSIVQSAIPTKCPINTSTKEYVYNSNGTCNVYTKQSSFLKWKCLMVAPVYNNYNGSYIEVIGGNSYGGAYNNRYKLCNI